MNLSDFTSRFSSDGFARANTYEFTIDGGGWGGAEKLKFLAKSTQTPSMNVGPIDVNYMGMIYKVAGDVTFDDLTVTVMADNDYTVRDAFESWMAKIRARGASTGGVPSTYKAHAKVKLLKYADETISAVYTYVGLFPISLSAIDLSYDSRDTIAEYTVTFSYDYWNTSDGTERVDTA
jgi:hypothetical protein